ncbi:MAG: response regulator [Desulfobacteraceae bacterium]|nr:response regulator [Desulfobacteraceae bacterium]
MPLKVLTVDDSITIRKIVRKAFIPYNVNIIEAENGVEGLATANKEKPDLIILDITMPIMCGIEMLSKLKEEKNLKDIPIIMLTAESGRSKVTEVIRMGIRDYMVKPFKANELIARAKKLVRLANSQ